MQDYLTPCEVLEGNADCWTSMINGWPPYFNINPVPPITNWWIRMPLQGPKISFGTHTRNGSTMVNTPWHVKIDARELFYSMIFPVGGTWSNWSNCLNDSKAWTLHRCPWNFDIWQLRWMLSQEPWENPSWGGEVPLVTTWNYRCYCFDEKWSWKTRLNGSSQHLYPVAAWVNELIESIKTTFMEDVSTRVLETIKNI